MSDFLVKGIIKVRTRNLHFQYIEPVFNGKFWPKPSYMKVSNSPHVKFLVHYDKVGKNWGKLWDTEYVQMMLYWNSIGHHKRTNKFIRSKIDRMLTLYKSIKRHGYLKQHAIEVLNTSFWETRYKGKVPFPHGMEIWHGHHRAAACYVCGIEKVKCKLLLDRRPGSLKCKRIDKRLKDISK